MTGFVLLWSAIGLSLSLAWGWFIRDCPLSGGTVEFFKVYSANCRTPIFSAFVTLGSFMLTLKSAILTRLKEGWDNEYDYQNYILTCPDLENPSTWPPYYDGLRNIGTALAGTVVVSLLTAGLQMTAGFVPNPWLLGMAVGAANCSLLLVIRLCNAVFVAQRRWFDKIEQDRKAAIAARLEKEGQDFSSWEGKFRKGEVSE